MPSNDPIESSDAETPASPTEDPQPEAPEAEAPEAEAPEAEAPEAEAPEAKAPEAEAPEAEGPVFTLEEAVAGLEALLYASGDSLNMRDLKKLLPEAGDHLRPALVRLAEDYARDGRGLQIVEVAGGWQITTRPEYHEVVERLVESPKPARLSLQALESLAVIAYRQPITIPEIMELRGVRSAGVVRTLLEKKLVKIVGRKNVVGRPLLYGTTKEFLLRFGLKDVKDLPQLKDMSEVFGDEVAQQLEVLEGMEPAEVLPVEGEDATEEPVEGESDSESESENEEPRRDGDAPE